MLRALVRHLIRIVRSLFEGLLFCLIRTDREAPAATVVTTRRPPLDGEDRLRWYGNALLRAGEIQVHQWTAGALYTRAEHRAINGALWEMGLTGTLPLRPQPKKRSRPRQGGFDYREPTARVDEILSTLVTRELTVEVGRKLVPAATRVPGLLSPLTAFWYERGLDLPRLTLRDNLGRGERDFALLFRESEHERKRLPEGKRFLKEEGRWRSGSEGFLDYEVLILEMHRAVAQYAFRLFHRDQVVRWARHHQVEIGRDNLGELASLGSAFLQAGLPVPHPERWAHLLKTCPPLDSLGTEPTAVAWRPALSFERRLELLLSVVPESHRAYFREPWPWVEAKPSRFGLHRQLGTEIRQAVQELQVASRRRRPPSVGLVSCRALLGGVEKRTSRLLARRWLLTCPVAHFRRLCSRHPGPMRALMERFWNQPGRCLPDQAKPALLATLLESEELRLEFQLLFGPLPNLRAEAEMAAELLTEVGALVHQKVDSCRVIDN